MRQLAALITSAVLHALIYWRINISTLFDAMRGADWGLLTISILCIMPLTLATAWRFSMLTRAAGVRFVEAIRMVLGASTLNLFLPSKIGDIAKAAVLVEHHNMDVKLALSISIFDKALDITSLLFFGVIALFWVGPSSSRVIGALTFVTLVLLLVMVGLILPFGPISKSLRVVAQLAPSRIHGRILRFIDAWQSFSVWFWEDRRRALEVLSLSIAIWFGHLMQYWLFVLSLGAHVPLLENIAYATLGILAGLLPVTFAGIGSRDAALIYFYGAYLTPGQGAFLGVLATLRYIIPALAGLPFVIQFVHTAGKVKRT
jgi:uncharacterized protein (TIRG00374 family)